MIQQTMHPNIKFDMNIVQQQATQLEGEEFLKNGSWTWNNAVQQKYKNAISKKDMIKTNPDASLINAQKIYNQNAIRELLIQNDKKLNFKRIKYLFLIELNTFRWFAWCV